MSDGAQSLDLPMFAELARRVHPERPAESGRMAATEGGKRQEREG